MLLYKNIIYLILLFSFNYAVSIKVYSRDKRIIKTENLFFIDNGKIIFEDTSSIIKNIIPINTIHKIRYSTKTYKPLGTPFQLVGGFLFGTSFLAASIISDFSFIEQYGLLSLGVLAIGWGINSIGSLINRGNTYFDLDKLEYIDKILILESILEDMKSKMSNRGKGVFNTGHGGRGLFFKKKTEIINTEKEKKRALKKWKKEKRIKEKKFLDIGW